MPAKSERERIDKDLREFHESLREIRLKNPPENLEKNLVRAEQYLEDATFFLGKGDLFTAWGAINYAHGILDAVRLELGMECYGALA